MTKRLTIALVALAMFVLVAVLPVSAISYNKVNTSINAGASVYIGETGLDFTNAINYFAFDAPTQIGWWSAGADLVNTPYSASFPLIHPTGNTISYAAFGLYTQNWYAINSTTHLPNTTSTFFVVKEPQLAVDVWDWDLNPAYGGTSVSGKTVIQGDKLGFKISTDMDNAINQPRLRTCDNAGVVAPTLATVGWAQIRVKSDQQNVLTKLYNGSANTGGAVAVNITNQVVDSPVWYWGLASRSAWDGFTGDINWSTDARDQTGQHAYPAGSYTVYVDSYMNGMMDQYQLSGAMFTGKTQSASQIVTLVSNTVKIIANKDTVVRSKPFSVTITGRPGQSYHLWIKGTSTMDGSWDNQPPMLVMNQLGVIQDAYSPTARYLPNLSTYNNTYNIPMGTLATSNAGGYQFQNGAGTGYNDKVLSSTVGTIWNTVAHGERKTVNGVPDYTTLDKLGNGTYLYANVVLSDGGTRTVEWLTTNWTKAQKYTLRVEQNFGTSMSTGSNYKSDEVDVSVQKGAVTIVAAGHQSYYLGEEIKFSGTNTETSTTYLMITGPNLKSVGSQIASTNPRYYGVDSNAPNTFQQASVLGDNTWSWKWGTSTVAIDAGTYTIWALSGPAEANAADELNQIAFGTVSIIIKKPFISATTSQSTVAQGDKVTISGTAEGSPSSGVQIWIMGKNYASVEQKAVNTDSSFSFEISRATTAILYPGQYFVVAQHPMQNNLFDVYPTDNLATLVASNTPGTSGELYVVNRQATTVTTGGTQAVGSKLFNLLGQGNLQGSDAAEALVQGINSANIDDTYTKLQFLVEKPIITITPVGDRHVGDKFTITATTNLAVDDDVLCVVTSSSFSQTQKTQSGAFSGASGTAKVNKGTTGMNTISFEVDASTFKPDEYIVTMDGVIVGATGTALFNVLEGTAPTATPKVVVPTTVPTVVVPTTVPSQVPTPTKTPTQPGFGALVALIGLGAVAFFVVRRH